MLFCWAYFWGSLFSEGLIIGGNVAFQNGLGLTIKTANSNSPWAYIREGLLSEGYLRLKFRGLIFGRAYFWEGLLSEFYGYLLTIGQNSATFNDEQVEPSEAVLHSWHLRHHRKLSSVRLHRGKHQTDSFELRRTCENNLIAWQQSRRYASQRGGEGKSSRGKS